MNEPRQTQPPGHCASCGTQTDTAYPIRNLETGRREVHCIDCFDAASLASGKELTSDRFLGTCDHCEIDIHGDLPESSYLYCSTYCKGASLTKRKRIDKGYARHNNECLVCRKEFKSSRSDAVTCGSRCRTKLCRARATVQDL